MKTPASIEEGLGGAEAQVYAVFMAHPDEGCTTEEVEQILKQKSVSARVIALWNRNALIKTGETRVNTSGRRAFVYAIPGLRAPTKPVPEKNKETPTMAKKSKKIDRTWHKKVISVFVAQEDKGTGFTYNEMRAAMELGDEDEGYDEIPAVMMNLRDGFFLAHKFLYADLKNDFFLGSPSDIPNIQKREDDGVIQTVFFLSPGASTLAADKAEEAAEAGELPNTKLPEGIYLFTRETIAKWMDGLGELIDLYSTDAAFNKESGKMLQALMPSTKTK